MALTFTHHADITMGGNRVRAFDIQLDSSYPSGGYSVDKSKFGLAMFKHLQIHNQIASGYAFEWDFTNSKILCKQCAGSGSPMSEVSAGTDLSSVHLDVFAVGH